jgi:hypothetical protein
MCIEDVEYQKWKISGNLGQRWPIPNSWEKGKGNVENI